MREGTGMSVTMSCCVLLVCPVRMMAVGIDSSMKLSPYLSMGLISPRAVHQEVMKCKKQMENKLQQHSQQQKHEQQEERQQSQEHQQQVVPFMEGPGSCQEDKGAQGEVDSNGAHQQQQQQEEEEQEAEKLVQGLLEGADCVLMHLYIR